MNTNKSVERYTSDLSDFFSGQSALAEPNTYGRSKTTRRIERRKTCKKSDCQRGETNGKNSYEQVSLISKGLKFIPGGILGDFSYVSKWTVLNILAVEEIPLQFV